MIELLANTIEMIKLLDKSNGLYRVRQSILAKPQAAWIDCIAICWVK